MSKVKHTSGPWDAKDYRVCAGVAPGGPPIKVICDTANNAKSRTPENEANAKLIAAAPDLLAALNAMSAMWDDSCVRTDVLNAVRPHERGSMLQAFANARAAIAKATTP